MADLSLFRQLAASCAKMLPLLPKEELDEARKISRMFTKAVEDMETVSKMLTSDQDKKFIKVEVVEQAEDRGPKIVETSGADVKPSDVDEILTKYKIGTEIYEMEVDAIKVESKVRPTVSQKKKEEEEEKEKGLSETLDSDQFKIEEHQREENLSSNENTSKSLQEVAKLENATCNVKTIHPESKSESRGWKRRRSIDVEIPLKKIKSENELENKSLPPLPPPPTPQQHVEDNQGREMKCKV